MKVLSRVGITSAKLPEKSWYDDLIRNYLIFDSFRLYHNNLSSHILVTPKNYREKDYKNYSYVLDDVTIPIDLEQFPTFVYNSSNKKTQTFIGFLDAGNKELLKLERDNREKAIEEGKTVLNEYYKKLLDIGKEIEKTISDDVKSGRIEFVEKSTRGRKAKKD